VSAQQDAEPAAASDDLDPSRVVAHLARAVARGAVAADPFLHLVVDGALPPGLVERLVADLPSAGEMVGMRETGWQSVSRYHLRGTRRADDLRGRSDPLAWQEVTVALTHPEVEARLREAFASWIPAPLAQLLRRPLRRELWLDCDDAGSYLLPHTDAPSTFVKAIVYLSASTAHPSTGTVLYRPRDPEARRRRFADGDYTDDDYRHETREEHEEAARVPLRPGRMLAFLRSRDSLHGLDPVAPEAAPRYLLSLHIKYARPDPPPGGLRGR